MGLPTRQRKADQRPGHIDDVEPIQVRYLPPAQIKQFAVASEAADRGPAIRQERQYQREDGRSRGDGLGHAVSIGEADGLLAGADEDPVVQGGGWLERRGSVGDRLWIV